MNLSECYSTNLSFDDLLYNPAKSETDIDKRNFLKLYQAN